MHRGALLAVLLAVLAPVASPAAGPPPEPGGLDSVHGCRLVYERYPPAAGSQRGLEVLLAHGFRRDLERMRGWALHWQSLGIATTVMTLCNSTWFNGRHARNADDLLALAAALDIERPVYAGFSAGGLVAYLAAARDPRALAYLGLDAVDSGRLALEVGAPPGIPTLFITAGPSACNARGNFAEVIARHDPGASWPVRGASHCDFEWPSDKRCRWVCGSGTAESRQAIQEAASDWLLELAGAQAGRQPVP
jgi:pimeloyl-ACP methyl ester carboxylesterase